MKDFSTYQKFKSDMPRLAAEVYTQYKWLIVKTANKYHRANARIDPEDFCSDTYIKLVDYMKYIKEEKIKPETFSFHIYVKYSMQRVAYKEYKKASKISYSLDDENFTNVHSYMDDDIQNVFLQLNVASFEKTLTPRQKTILRYRRKGYTMGQIKDMLQVSHGTVAGDIWRAKQIYKEMF